MSSGTTIDSILQQHLAGTSSFGPFCLLYFVVVLLYYTSAYIKCNDINCVLISNSIIMSVLYD